MTSSAPPPGSPGSGLVEIRQHELRRCRLLMVDGQLTQNLRVAEAGVSVRVHDDGYWGFASAPSGTDITALRQRAVRNARAMRRFGPRTPLALPAETYRGEHRFAGQPEWSPAQVQDRMAAISAWCRQRYPGLRSVRVLASDEHHTKALRTDAGADCVASIQRALCYVTFMVEGEDGAPVELSQQLSGKGSLADLAWAPEQLAPQLDELHRHLQAKRQAVPARGGLHTVVLAPELAGMLAHEAMGHPCEADLVLGGSITGSLVGQRVASDLVTMVDLAHTYNGQETLVPVYADDEGTPARDAMLIERGLLRGFMSSRETAAQLRIPATGSARAYAPGDEPLVRMRNTVILPGTRKLADMVAEVEEGVLLLKTSNGQADSTTEFMFGINLAYEIRQGRLGRALRDTTVSGSAIQVLQSVDAVSDDMHFSCSGYCGKKQPMVVSMGGPALRARAHIGGQ